MNPFVYANNLCNHSVQLFGINHRSVQLFGINHRSVQLFGIKITIVLTLSFIYVGTTPAI
jgi:hypothetical protein